MRTINLKEGDAFSSENGSTLRFFETLESRHIDGRFVRPLIVSKPRRGGSWRHEPRLQGVDLAEVKAKRGSTVGYRVTPARSERTSRMRKSSKSSVDETLAWQARMSASRNGMEGRLRRETGPLPGGENL
jgi:hypothetical protein